MEHVKRRVLCVSMVVALLLLSIAVTGVAVSQPVQKGNAKGKVAKAMSGGGVAEEVASTNRVLRAPIRIVHSGYGFAINEEEEFHVLRVHIVKRRFFQPKYIRELMGEDKNIEELRAEIEEAGGRPIYQGHLRLGEKHYRLVNMSIDNGTDGNQLFDADIVGPLRNLEPGENMSIAGHISMAVMRYEGARIGEGELTMSEGDYIGEYSVLLDMRPLWPILRKENK